MEYIISQLFSHFRMIFAVALIALAMFFWADIQQQEIVKQATANFVERVRYEGYISREMYEEYANSISFAPYKILLYHKRYRLNQNQQRVLTVYDRNNILNTIYAADQNKDKIYKMEKGDDFQVMLAPLQPSTFQYLISFISRTSIQREPWMSRGGMVFNLSYE